MREAYAPATRVGDHPVTDGRGDRHPHRPP